MMNVPKIETAGKTTKMALKRKETVAANTKVETKIVTLTPAMAEAFLAVNENNRNISPTSVNKFAADIIEGRWVFNGEPIIVAENGELNDGQHRCAAVVLAGKPITTLVVSGVPRAARFSTDMGQARTQGHLLSMAGVANANTISRAAGLMLQMDKVGHLTRGAAGYGSITKQAIVDYAHQHLEELEQAYDVVGSNNVKMIGAAGVLMAAFILIARKSTPALAAEFFQSLIDGTNLGKRNPIYVARERLTKERFNGHVPPRVVIEIILRAWNLHRTGKAGRIFVLGEFPEIES